MNNILVIGGLLIGVLMLSWCVKTLREELSLLKLLNRYNRIEADVTRRYILATCGPHYEEAKITMELEVRDLIRAIKTEGIHPRIVHNAIIIIDDRYNDFNRVLKNKIEGKEK